MTSSFIEKALIAKEELFHLEGMDENTLYQMCVVINEGIQVVTDKLNKKYKTPYPCSAADFIGMPKEEYDEHI